MRFNWTVASTCNFVRAETFPAFQTLLWGEVFSDIHADIRTARMVIIIIVLEECQKKIMKQSRVKFAPLLSQVAFNLNITVTHAVIN